MRPQFSLAALFAVTTWAAVVLGVGVYAARVVADFPAGVGMMLAGFLTVAFVTVVACLGAVLNS